MEHRLVKAPGRRVLMAVHSAQRGGAQLVALGQARALTPEHELVVAIGRGPLRGAFAELAAAVVRGPVSLPIWGASPARWALQGARTLADAARFAGLVRRHRIDVVVVNSTVLVGPVLGARLAGVPVIVQAQEAPKSAAARRLFRVHGALAQTVLAISGWVAEGFDGARARVVRAPVGIPVPPDPGPREAFSADPVQIVMVGTVDRHKRPADAIAAVRELGARGVDARLTLYGPEADREYAVALRRQACDLRVHFAGPTDDVAARLLAADVLVVPAGEVTPLVLMEAMALRTPVVAADMGSIPDVVTDGESGLLVAPGDPGALATAVARLRDEPGLAGRLAEGGRRRVEQDFDETRTHDRLAAEIRRLTGRRTVVRRHAGAVWRRARAAVLRWRLRASPAPIAGALVYHESFDVVPPGEQIVPGIAAATLERHLRHLRRAYAPVAASQLHAAMLGRRRGGRIPIAVTFDDDLASHLDIAAPLLRRLACPATFFLTGAGLDRPHAFWWQRLQAAADRGFDLRAAGLADQPLAELAADIQRSPDMRDAVARALGELLGEDPPAYRLSASQVRQLARDGFEIGFHTREHRSLPELADDELARALRDGRDALETAAGRPVTTIAYPHGRADERVAAAARAAGYTAGFGGPGGDRLLLRRAELLLDEPGAFAVALAGDLWADRRPVRRGLAERGRAAGAQAGGAQR